MNVEYKRDLHHNYLVINPLDNEMNHELMNTNQYCIKMLEYQSVDGVLPIEQRTIDNQPLFYYDITGMQSLEVLHTKKSFSVEEINQLFRNLIHTIEKAYEFLIIENDFLLVPEYIFCDLKTQDPSLCYLPGYDVNIKDQMSDLIEYVMNKVDYKDKETVLLIYQLYAASKENGFVFSHLTEILEGKREKSTEESIQYETITKRHNQTHTEVDKEKKPERPERMEEGISYVKEKVESEKEISCYPLRTYLYSIGCIAGGILLIFFCFYTKMIYNSFGSKIEISKLFVLMFIIACSELFAFRIIWDKKKKESRIVPHIEYIDPVEEEIEMEEKMVLEKNIGHLEEKESLEKNIGLEKNNGQERVDEQAEPSYPPTCLLNEVRTSENYILRPVNENGYESIVVNEFPFFVGKLRRNVDYCIDNEVVSRYHAKITKEKDVFYITDLNSTNGTFLNGDILTAYQGTELNMGDEVTFANIRYQFTIC